MNKKILSILGTVVVLGLISGGMAYIIKTDKLAGFLPASPQDESQEPAGEGSPEETPQETVVTKDDFSLTLPAGWQEIAPPTGTEMTVLVMAVDSQEEITDGRVEEASFRTNFSLKSDNLAEYTQNYSLSEYVEEVKTGLIQAISNIEFTEQSEQTIDGYDAILVECESTQQEINFKTLLVFIKGNNDILWALSFNTLYDSWPKYQDVFYQIAESFKLRYEM
jgi:hypothetical protein